VVQSSLSALPEGRSRFTVRSTLLFIVKPNGFIKAMIDKGAAKRAARAITRARGRASCVH
jgi:hypothetical protein